MSALSRLAGVAPLQQPLLPPSTPFVCLPSTRPPLCHPLNQVLGSSDHFSNQNVIGNELIGMKAQSGDHDGTNGHGTNGYH